MTVEEYAKLIPDEKARQQFLESMKNEWVPKADFTKATQAKADELKTIQAAHDAQVAENARYMKWYKEEYEPYAARMRTEAEKRAANPTPSSPANPNPNGAAWYENWEAMTPQQQAQELYKQQVNYANAIAQQYGKAFQDGMTTLNQQVQDQFGVYIDALERRHKDPSLDIQQFLDKAKNFKTQNFNPLDAAYKEVTYEKDKEKWLEEGRKLGRQDLETEQKARAPVAPRIDAGPEPFKPNLVKKEDRMAELKTKVTEKLGPQVWGP